MAEMQQFDQNALTAKKKSALMLTSESTIIVHEQKDSTTQYSAK